MIQHYFNTGTTLIVANLELFQKFNTEQVMQDEIRILVDTSVARTVILPRITEFPVRNVRITVVDVSGSASGNNITVMASTGSPNDAINGSPTYTISSNFAANRFEPLDTNGWFVIDVGSGGGGAPLVVSMTYAQLIAAIGANALVAGQSILLTDYATATYIQYSGSLGSEQVNVGSVEPLLLRAISNYEVSNAVESIFFPQDSITYFPIMADREYDYAAAQGKGCITYRKDNQYLNARDYDFRNVIFRRWETVNGSGIYNSYTETGFGYTDYPAFPNLGASRSYVGSPLYLASLFGAPYWLDNTIVTESSLGIECTIAFANTFRTFDLCEIYGAVGNYCNIFEGNFGNSFINNSYQGMNIIGNYGNVNNNQINGIISYNFTKAIDGNISSVSNALITENNCYEINGNLNFTLISKNKSGDIRNNTVDEIYRNSVSIVMDNVGGHIVGNTGKRIESNTLFDLIEDNSMVDILTNSTLNISRNVGQVIQGNSGLQIADNTVGAIKNNADFNGILGNSGSKLNDVICDVSRVSTINYNSVNEISSSFLGVFSFNENTGTHVGALNITAGGSIDSCVFGVLDNDTVTGGLGIVNNRFLANIYNKNFTPTASMASPAPTITLHDIGVGDVEQVLNAGILVYTPF